MNKNNSKICAKTFLESITHAYIFDYLFPQQIMHFERKKHLNLPEPKPLKNKISQNQKNKTQKHNACKQEEEDPAFRSLLLLDERGLK